MNNISEKFFEEMAADFFAECDELLMLIKKNLLIIDKVKGAEQPEKQVVEDLLRSCHTLKGLTGMIGAEPVMKLIHSIENYLKIVYSGNQLIPASAVDILFKSINIIESQIEALRNKIEIPSGTEILRELESLMTESDSEKVNGQSTARILTEYHIEDQNMQLSESRWKFTFTPSSALFSQGININDIRVRIQKIGRILSSVPRTIENGKIQFDFIVATDKPEAAFSADLKDILHYEPVEQESLDHTGETIKSGHPGSVNFQAETAGISQRLTQKNIIRVDLTKLEDIMRSVGELVISRSRLQDQLENINQGKNNNGLTLLQDINSLMERQLRELRESIMKLRLVTAGEAFERMRFVVRDMIRESNKEINLEFEGWETQVDKSVIEKMLEPLIHLVRNAVSHGLETSEKRIEAGKPTGGKLRLRASAIGSSVLFEIEDDGAGIDEKEIREKAESKGFLEPGKPHDLSVLDIISLPGFTTREHSDMASGRGIGMDVVKKSVQELGGTLDMQSEKGKGTKFTIQVPFTLSIMEALIVRIGKNLMAVPMAVINEVIRFSRDDMVKFENYEMIKYHQGVLPFVRLDEFFGYEGQASDSAEAMVTGSGSSAVGIAVDKILGRKEIVIRSLTDPLVKVEGILGATELGEGKIVLIIDVPAVIRSAGKKHRSGLIQVSTI